MNTTLTLMDLGGAIALLIWGVHMVQTGITRAFGPQLRRMLSYALGTRFKAFPRRLGRNVNPPEQDGYRTDCHGIRRRRACRPGASVGRDAGRQCRHDADRPGAVTRCIPGFVSVHPDRRFHVSAQRGYPHARSGTGGDRTWPDAHRASAPAFDD